MKVSEIMTRDVRTVAPSTSIQEAAELMRQLDVGPLPVCDDDKVVGIVTDREIVIRGVALGRDLSTPVEAVMTPGVEWCKESDDVQTAVSRMKEKQVRRLIVLDDDKRLVGILSLGDIATDAEDDRLSGDTLEAVSEPSVPLH